MQHARYECPSATLRRTLKRRRSSMYEASGFFAVTSASSAFSALVPVAAICASCKRALHCSSDGCGAAAVRGVCSSRGEHRAGQRRRCARQPHRPRPYTYRQMRLGLHVKRARACVRACVRKLLAPVAACKHAKRTHGMQHATGDMRHATCNIHPLAILCVADAARSMPCSDSQRNGCGAAVRCRCTTGDAR
jgi:hypothetical protein